MHLVLQGTALPLYYEHKYWLMVKQQCSSQPLLLQKFLVYLLIKTEELNHYLKVIKDW